MRLLFWNMNRLGSALVVAELAWQESADVVILAECGATPAALLGEKTKQLVMGEVVTQTTGTLFVHSFFLVAPTLNYRYELFRAQHHVGFYPPSLNWGHNSPPCPLGGGAQSEAEGSLLGAAHGEYRAVHPGNRAAAKGSWQWSVASRRLTAPTTAILFEESRTVNSAATDQSTAAQLTTDYRPLPCYALRRVVGRRDGLRAGRASPDAARRPRHRGRA